MVHYLKHCWLHQSRISHCRAFLRTNYSWLCASQSLCCDPFASSMEPVPVAPSHGTSAGNDLSLLEFTPTSSVYASVVCHPQGFDSPGELLVELSWSSPDAMPNTHAFTLLNLVFLADIVDAHCISTNDQCPTCDCFAEAMVGIVDLLRASEIAHDFSSPFSTMALAKTHPISITVMF
ncbi:hypothetical protein K443DRAFT_647547 [Laccaria amethystina LaAM-08-1]|uniref:Uncharacterized protein n=1 Tax=Laccaria amethystina LaAM-08-1 TaxID=1095629 RepID=A0A0C9Y8Z1_9AGAR|nr:hypothetical protein K443DRAFT_647547 [Laccaria amethystina LaAM-08-1]